ncbi:MAG TPA: flavodoxin domain-containing protein [Thermoleophilia bacterium]|nr:flavodoxin domain-containing protein [Thermoleophilia bacterium]
MNGKVLVAYATHYGSTREVAEAVAARLSERGFEAEVKPVKEADPGDGYAAVVVGMALYFFRIHRDARRFLKRHQKSLRDLPVAVFAMGPVEDKPEQFADARRRLDEALAKREWLPPVSVALFGGKLDPQELRFPHNNPAMKQVAAADLRDWAQIEAWADEVAAKFGDMGSA